jgi:hypothetical protein
MIEDLRTAELNSVSPFPGINVIEGLSSHHALWHNRLNGEVPEYLKGMRYDMSGLSVAMSLSRINRTIPWDFFM